MRVLRVIAAALTLAAVISSPARADTKLSLLSPGAGGTKLLLLLCDEYLKHGSDGADAAAPCVLWFGGWTAAFTLSVGSTLQDGTPVYGGICPPEIYSAVDVIKKFVSLVHQYPDQFSQPIFNDPMYSVPYTLKQAWPCKHE